MFEREKSVSTYMGNFLAIPHGTNEAKDAITRSAISVVRYDAPIDWDGNEVRFAVGIAGRRERPPGDPREDRDRLLRHRRGRQAARRRSAEELYDLLQAVNED